MFFLLRMAFWLGVVCVLLPGGGKTPETRIDAASAVSAAGAALSDMRGFCARQPDACVTGGKVAVAIGAKAESGARTLFELISAQLTEHSAGTKTPGAEVIPASARGTLTASDLTPAWHTSVPLPPRREARAGRPAV